MTRKPSYPRNLLLNQDDEDRTNAIREVSQYGLIKIYRKGLEAVEIELKNKSILPLDK